MIVVGVVVLLLLALGAAAFLLGGDDDGPAPPVARVSGSNIGDAGGMAPPTQLQAQAKPFSVRLTWEAAEGGVGGFVILRDGDRIGRVGTDERSFVDDEVLPGVHYRYEVETVAAGEAATSTALSVLAPRAPLARARIEGLYSIDTRDTSHFGFSSFAGGFQSGWRFKPRCRQGPCSVTWKDVQGAQLSGVLSRRGARYEGSGTARFATCGNVTSSGTITVRLEITRAASLRGAWRALKLRGTLVERSAAQLGCVASGADYDITATLIA